MDINEAMAQAISAERAIAKITIRDLAVKSGIPVTSLQRVLSADREIKISQVAAVAAVFGLYPHEIVEHAERIMDRVNRISPQVELPEAPDAKLYSFPPHAMSDIPDNVAASKNDGTHLEFEGRE